MHSINIKAYIIAVLALCCALLTGCTSQVKLSSGSFPANSESVTAVVQAGDISALDKLSALRSLDLSGSTCYAEISQWAQAHPQVDVRYTVTLPSGKNVDNSATSLDLSKCTKEELFAAAELLQYLPDVKTLNVGNGILSEEEFIELAEKHPGLIYDGQISAGSYKAELDAAALDLTGISTKDAAALIKVLPFMKDVSSIELGNDTNSFITWEDIAAIEAACPNADVNYSFTLYGKHFDLSSERMILSHKKIDDNGALIRRILPCMPELNYLDMDTCGVSDEDMASIRDAFPNIKVVWRIWFGIGYSVRTDVEKILASNPDAGGELNSSNCSSLKYCTSLKYLDLGHNVELEDISFVSSMPDLEVAILAMVRVTDFSPLADCPHLEFLELGASGLHDLTPLSNLKELRHLSVPSDPCLYDISPIYGLTELERLWIGPWTPISQDQLDKMQECAPNCVIDTYSEVNASYEEGHPGWRYIGRDEDGHAILHPRYALLWKQFDYGNVPYSYAYASNDPLYYGSSEP